MEQNIVDNNLSHKNFQKQQLPNSIGTLVLGILSIVFCWCYGIPGMALGIIALVISSKSVKMYNENPDLYEGFGNIKAGRITAIIGLSLSSLYIVILIIYFAVVGTALFSTMDLFDEFY